ncbi:hypothetical protein ACHAXS_000655, partial [Conticribra weissflogii]
MVPTTTRPTLHNAILYGQVQCQVDFLQAYIQAPIEVDMHINLPGGIKPAQMQLHRQKQAGRVWNQYLVKKLHSIGFKKSKVGECVFYCNDVLKVVYVNDGIFLGKSDKQLESTIHKIKSKGINMEDQKYPADYVGMNIHKHANVHTSLPNEHSLIQSYKMLECRQITPSLYQRMLPSTCINSRMLLRSISTSTTSPLKENGTMWFKSEDQISCMLLIRFPSTLLTLTLYQVKYHKKNKNLGFKF